MTSGAIQCGVPMKVLRLDMVPVSCAATPKSASLTPPSAPSKMLPHLMSRCTCCHELSCHAFQGRLQCTLLLLSSVLRLPARKCADWVQPQHLER